MYMIQSHSIHCYNNHCLYGVGDNPKIIDKLYKKLIKEQLFSDSFNSQFYAGRYAYLFTSSYLGSPSYFFRDLTNNLCFEVGGVKL